MFGLTRSQLLRGSGIAALALLSAACSGKSGVGSGALSVPPGLGFVPADLAGDWTGILQPSNPTKKPFNFYLRFDPTGELTTAVDGIGHEWSLAKESDGMEAVLEPSGGCSIIAAHTRDAVGPDDLALSGTMNLSRTSVTGSFTLREYGVVRAQGSFQVFLSSGAGHFNQAILGGSWQGIGFRDWQGRWRAITLDLASEGSVLAGGIENRQFEAQGVNTGVFTYLDTAIGRMDNVVVTSTDGSTTTLDYLLVDETGSVMSGVGTDSILGDGIIHLSR